MKQQVVIIHGGDAFKNYEDYLENLKTKDITIERIRFVGWKENLKRDLGDKFDVLTPKMPNAQNAKYEEWKIWFEKIIPLLDKEIILIGHSLGGIFILKYLSENNYPKKIKATFLIAAPYNTPDKHLLADFIINISFDNFIKQAGKVFLYHSKDDPIVPFNNMEEYKKAIPDSQLLVFQDKGHFNLESFPELIKNIRKLNNNS
jgi:uncharacterized protein